MAYIPGYGFLSNPYIVFNDANGKPLSNGTVETYIAGTTTAYNTLKDWNGTYNGAIITLDIYGGCTIIAPETQGLKLIVKTSTGAAYKTFDNVFIGGSNQGYIPGTTVIRVDGTDGEIISVGTPDPDDPDKLIFTISLDPAITEAIATNASDISNIETSITNIEDSLQTKESLQYTGFRINSGSGPYFVKIAEASFQSGYGSMDLTCGVGGSSTAYGEFSVKVIRAINGTSMYAQWNSLFNRASTFQLEEIRCFYVGPNDIQLWAKTASPFTQSSLSFEPLINVRYSSSGVATGRAFSFQKVGTTGSYPSTYVNYCLAKSVDCLSASDQRRTNVTSSDASVEVTKTETYDGKGYTNTFDVSVQSGQVDTYKSMCSIGDIPGYLQDKLVGSDWLNVTEIPLSANEKNIKFALKDPDFFVKGATIYGGTILPATTGDFNSPVHDGYFTGYYNTLNAPPAQPGNPSWFVHHMNSNAGTAYAVQIAYAYTTSIICYERTKVAGVWQAWTLRSSGSDESVESINVIEVVENENHAATVIIPYGYFNKIANIRSTLSSLTLKMSELPDTDHAYSFHATMTPLSNLGITTFKVVGPGNSILAIGDTLTSKVIKFSAEQLNHLYASLADQTLVTATASISYAVVTHTLSVGTETIVLDGAATDDAYFVCSGVFGVVTAIGAMEFDPPTLYRDVTWLGTAPALVGGKTYEISVVNGCGVIGGSV